MARIVVTVFIRPDWSYHDDTYGSYLIKPLERTAPLVGSETLFKINLLFFFYFIILFYFYIFFCVCFLTYYPILPSNAGAQVLDAVCIYSGRAAKNPCYFHAR